MDSDGNKAVSAEENSEIDELLEIPHEADEPDVVSCVLARPKLYPFAYRSLVKRGKRYSKYHRWVARTAHCLGAEGTRGIRFT